ncbi:MAG TPA: aminotransferase class I/II-fold pyridoxal phosphate-dependent enzyme, partial [Geminicoccaceae bacterium]|nr:aminotransferase class I/II-fold pyridoxal phosphate-dependent enzyme [Geminicoccaceae bacterium]
MSLPRLEIDPTPPPRPFLRPEVEALRYSGIARIALQGLGDPDVIPLWFGEGDLPTPGPIREAAKAALDAGETFYSFARGRLDLREALKAYLDRLYGIDLDPDRITVPGSTMAAITIASQMVLGRGDHGLVVSPNWPNIERSFAVTGAEVGFVRQREIEGRWALDLDDLFAACTDRTRAIFVNTPCNPTGWVMTGGEQARLLEFCRERGIALIADEVYHRNVFGGDVAPSFMALADDDDPVIVVNGFSKAWAMTGWRLGWMIAPSRYVEQMAVLSECFNTGATSFVQCGGVAALTEAEGAVRELREQYRVGRDMVMEILGRHPRLTVALPEGAFYAFPRVRG